MTFPIANVATQDGYILHGLISEPQKKSDYIVIHIHGSAGNFYQSSFYPTLFKIAEDLNIAFLSTNSRGTGVYDFECGTKPRGAAIEIFEECLIDIDSWIEFANSKGYQNIILEGHSFGTNKIQYYALNGKYKSQIKALILLGFTDSYGGQLEYLKKKNLSNEDILKEAETLIKENKSDHLLSDLNINWGELPQSAKSYKNMMSPGSELSKILPFSNNQTLSNFQKIQIPILGVVGDRNECTVIPPQDAVKLLNSENPNANCFVISDCNHSYIGKEKELGEIIKTFIDKLAYFPYKQKINVHL
jgi:pimeloyl-ACP methyl ester carboxylesterase